jgi:hypothetical protein
MANDTTEPVTVGDVGALLAQLRELSGRYARFEDVPQGEVDAYMARKRDVLGRINREALL